jgi:hypothetical protein
MPKMKTCSLSRAICPSRGEPQPIEEFRWMPVSRRYTKTCATCRERNAKHQEVWRGLNPEEDKKTSAKWCKKNQKELLAYSRRYYQMKKDEAASSQ